LAAFSAPRTDKFCKGHAVFGLTGAGKKYNSDSLIVREAAGRAHRFLFISKNVAASRRKRGFDFARIVMANAIAGKGP